MELRVLTRVQVTIELDNLGTWSPETSLDQIHKQAKEAAIGRLNIAFRNIDHSRVRLIAVPKIVSVTVEKENG